MIDRLKGPALRRAFLLLALVVCASVAHAREGITQFVSEIWIRADGTIDITETMDVNAEGGAIRRGIVRAFPTRYDADGFVRTVPFEVLSVTRNGKPEPYDIEDADNGELIRIGDEGTYLARGNHSYQITYRISRVIGFFDDYDSLYWNVTGNGTPFWIDAVSVMVHLPEGAAVTGLEVYTGAFGEERREGNIREIEPGLVLGETTAALSPHEGMTIVVGLPKGAVTPPGLFARVWYWITDNPGGIIALIGVALLSLYSWYGRWREGPDPEPGIIIPRFDAKDDLSAADARFLDFFLFDDVAFAAAVLNLAARGFVRIEKVSDKNDDELYEIRKLDKPGADKLPPPERKLMADLFTKKRKVYRFDKTNARTTRKVFDTIKKDVEKRHMEVNIRQRADRSEGCLVLLIVIGALIVIYTSGWINWVLATVGFLAMIVVGVLVEANARGATRAGQKKRDELEGLRMYLGTAEQERWNALHPPAMTPALFERLFPFALALGVAQVWSETFKRELEMVGADAAAFAPSFYSGGDFSLSDSSFTNSFSSAVSPPVISSSGSSPGSSSGFSDFGGGGGGFSGGGSGGGGVSGW